MTALDPKRHGWMGAAETRAVLDALGGTARFVGGAVRNALLGRAVGDIDLATPLAPEEVRTRLEKAGIRALPTGIEHGTITAIVAGKPFEVTTLRRDISTDGRRATVAFTTDWREDAARRDFTINALYAGADGTVFDYVGGLGDLAAGHVRFVGDARTRIREDYLRILRLFRFHAWYGKGEPDEEALRAAAAEKSGLARLSGERIQKEMFRLLEAEYPMAVLRAMETHTILGEILPAPRKLARLAGLVSCDANHFFPPDPVLRLAALLPDGRAADALSDRLRLSNSDRARLADLAGARERIDAALSVRDARKLLYRLDAKPFRDRVLLRWAEDPDAANAVAWRALLAVADAWARPDFPLSGREVMQAGVPEGPLVGKILAAVEAWWIESDFPDDRDALTERLRTVIQAMPG